MVTLPFWSKSTVAMSKNPFKETLSLDALVTNELLGAAAEPCGRLNSLNDDIELVLLFTVMYLPPGKLMLVPGIGMLPSVSSVCVGRGVVVVFMWYCRCKVSFIGMHARART